MAEMYRQGDVLLVAIERAPDARPVPVDNGRLVLAYGEVTGHAHTVAPEDAELVERDGELFVRVGTNGAAVTHEEHAPLRLPPGDYRVMIQREYEPKAPPRRVVD